MAKQDDKPQIVILAYPRGKREMKKIPSGIVALSFTALIAIIICVFFLATSCDRVVANPEDCSERRFCYLAGCKSWLCIESMTSCNNENWAMIEWHGKYCGDTTWVCPDHIHLLEDGLGIH